MSCDNNRVHQHLHHAGKCARPRPKHKPGNDCSESGSDVSVVADLAIGLIKNAGDPDEEHFVVIYPDTARGFAEMQKALMRFAENPELSFTGEDAVELSRQAGSM